MVQFCLANLNTYFFDLGLQLPFAPGVTPGVGSYPVQHRLDLALLAGAFFVFFFVVIDINIAHSCRLNDEFVKSSS